MADHNFEQMKFETPEALVKALTEKSDDFESIKIMVANDLPTTGPNGERLIIKDTCAMIKLCSGRSIVVHTDVLQEVLKQGVIHRLGIPIELIPIVKR